MTIRDDLERVGAEAFAARWNQHSSDAISDYHGYVRAVLDALLASRDPDGNRMVILASELEHVGMGQREGRGFKFVPTTRDFPESGWVPVFVLRPPSGEPDGLA